MKQAAGIAADTLIEDIAETATHLGPQNGMALCKNDHWIMDRHIIAPGPDMKWHVSRSLDDRIQGQDKVLALQGRPILLPGSERFHPRPDALEWRFGQLRNR